MRSLLIACLLAATCCNAVAAPYTATGTVTNVQSVDPSTSTTYYPGSALGDWFVLSGFTAAGNCHKADTGQILVEVKNDVAGRRQYTTVLTAMTLGRTVSIAIDDSNRDANGYCYLVAMRLN